jgi:hypothetical protein
MSLEVSSDEAAGRWWYVSCHVCTGELVKGYLPAVFGGVKDELIMQLGVYCRPED